MTGEPLALDTPPAQAPARARPHARRVVWPVAAVVLVVLAATTPGMVSIANGRAILSSVAFTGILAVGTVAIMVSGSLFSLSLGTTVAVTSMLFLDAVGQGGVLAVLVAVVAGAVVFGLQGALVGWWGANPIIVTIGAGALQTGLATWLLPGSVQTPDGTDLSLLTRTFLGLPFPVYVFVLIAVAVELLLRCTTVGKDVELVGENQAAARAAGLPIGLLVTAGFAVAGVCVGVTGVLIAGLNQNANLAVSGTFTFDAIAAAIVGGNSVAGGTGSAWRAVVGTCVIAVVTNALLLRGYSTGVRLLFEGLIVMVVVVLSQRQAREDAR